MAPADPPIPEERLESGIVRIIEVGRLLGKCAPNEALVGEKAASAVRLWDTGALVPSGASPIRTSPLLAENPAVGEVDLARE